MDETNKVIAAIFAAARIGPGHQIAEYLAAYQQALTVVEAAEPIKGREGSGGSGSRQE